jgi:hypothetical protein
MEEKKKKDPAVLLYTQDFLVGSSLMSPVQKGHYITLLCFQQQSDNGSLTLEDIQSMMQADFDKEWPALKRKFKQDANGFYNERMRSEVERRSKYSESRRTNRKSKEEEPVKEDMNNICSTYDKDVKSYDEHMETETEIETVLQDKGVQGEKVYVVPEMQKIFVKHNPQYPADKILDFHALQSISRFLSNLTNAPPETLPVWEKISAYIASNSFYRMKSLKTIANQIQNIYQETFNPQPKNELKQSGHNSKSAGAVGLLKELRADIRTYQGGK